MSSPTEASKEDRGCPTPEQPSDFKVSKSQLKREAKRARQQEAYKQRKALKKEKRQQARAEKREQLQEELSKLTPEEAAARKQRAIDVARERTAKNRAAKEAMRERLKHAQDHAAKIVIDLDFWDKMTDQEHTSLLQQLAYSVGRNSKSTSPCSLHLTSLRGPCYEAMAKQFPGHPAWHVCKHEAPVNEAFESDRQRLIYLTADAEEQIETLEADHAYIVGGIVDRNRYKKLCYEKAKGLGLRTARLPIGEHLKLLGSKVLTVNQVVDILVGYLETQDWKAACDASVPTRKTKDKGCAVNEGSADQELRRDAADKASSAHDAHRAHAPSQEHGAADPPLEGVDGAVKQE